MAVAILTSCIICRVRDGKFAPAVCPICREAMANLVLEGSPDVINVIWNISAEFDAAKARLHAGQRAVQRANPEASSVALLALGLLEQGMLDGALLNAAWSIRLGDSADVNTVNVQALAIVLDARLARPDSIEKIRTALWPQ